MGDHPLIVSHVPARTPVTVPVGDGNALIASAVEDSGLLLERQFSEGHIQRDVQVVTY